MRRREGVMGRREGRNSRSDAIKGERRESETGGKWKGEMEGRSKGMKGSGRREGKPSEAEGY